MPADLSFQQARMALDLLIAELQSNDLQIEEMLNLYRRAERYADHCEAVLRKVDQDVIEWDVLQEAREISS
ncbi:MAG: exodeoxyribonuclease VII small subunit [Cyanobacteriota bacterium]